MAMPRFIGRCAELQQIKDHWTKACKGQPQVINLVADTGVGKTRLVQAFYEWLSSDPEQGVGSKGYWPDDLGNGRQRAVNPPLESFAAFDLKKDRIPWLWWGMYWTDADGENECGLVRFHDFLDVHLSMLELQRYSHRKALTALTDAAKDETIDLLVGLIYGGSQVLSVINFAKQLLAIKKEQQEAQQGLASQDKNRQETLAESIIERLQMAFRPKRKDVPRVPLVLFLDDIHFATDVSHDGFSLQFLDRLLRQAAREQWPLLILTTHWKGPWQAHRRDVSLEEGKPWRRIMLEMEVEKSIKTPSVLALELDNVPSNDLRRIALDLLSGIDREDQDKILERVDNVRWLVEVLNALSDNVENFENSSRSHPLSAYGHRRLEELLKTRGYLEVIRQRLEGDGMREVRNVLGATAWHAHGLEFLSPLACAFGEELMEQGALLPCGSEPGQQVLGVLMRAIDPAALLEGQVQDNRLPSVVRFPERGYLEIAKELFDPGRLPALRFALGQEILAWMQSQGDQTPRWQQLDETSCQKAFLEIAMAVLEHLQPQLSEEQLEELTATEKCLRRRLEKGKITEAELQEELLEARQELLEEAGGSELPEVARWQAVAMAELADILLDEGNGRAWTLAFELAEHPHLTAALTATQFRASISLTDLWQDRTDCWPQARKLLDDLIQSQTALMKAEETPDRLSNLLATLAHLAELDIKAGATEPARAGFQCCLDICERLLAEFGETPKRLYWLTFLLERQADLDEVAGATEHARARYQRSLDIHERLLTEFGETPDFLCGLTIPLQRLACLDQNASATALARAGFQRSLDILERLLTEFGETPKRLRGLAISLERLAGLDRDAGATEQARVSYQRSLEICEHLLVEFGETPDRLRNLNVPLQRLADLDREHGATARARAGYQRFLEICERLLAEFGETPTRLRDLTVPLMNLADLDEAAGATAPARAGYQRCLDIYEHLLTEFGESPERMLDLIFSLERLANLDLDAGATEQARAGYQRSQETWERLLAEFGETPERLRGLTIPLQRLADLDQEAGAPEQARTGYRRSLEIDERLLAEFGETPERLFGLTISLERLADLDWGTGAPGQAWAGFQRSLEIRERLLAEFGETPKRLRSLAISLQRLADLDRDAGATVPARTGYQRSLEIWERLLAEFGETPKHLRGLTTLLDRLADLDRDAGAPEQARAGYWRSLEIRKRLLIEFGETPDRLRNLSVSLERLADLDRSMAGVTEQARAGFQRSLEIRERLLVEYGETPERLSDLAISLERLADLDEAAGVSELSRTGRVRPTE